MAVSSFEMWDDAFIEYTTIFRSRLGHCRVVAAINDTRQKQTSVLEKKVASFLFEEQIVRSSDPEWRQTIQYLNQKGYLSRNKQKSGRYKGLSLLDVETGEIRNNEGHLVDELSIYRSDYFLSDPAVRSTIGAPTLENVAEVIQTAKDFGVCNEKNQSIRISSLLTKVVQAKPLGIENPYTTEPIAPFYFYCLIKSDFFMLLAIATAVAQLQEFERDDVSRKFLDIIETAHRVCEAYFPHRKIARSLKLFSRFISETQSKFDGKGNRGPGVIEHRTTPRLEQLVDIGFLSKPASKRNSFRYSVTSQLTEFAERVGPLEERKSFAEVFSCFLAVRGGTRNPVKFDEIVEVYRKLAPKIGSISIDHLCVGLFSGHTSSNVESFYEALMSMRNDKRVRFTGGRYNRKAEFVWLDVKAFPQ